MRDGTIICLSWKNELLYFNQPNSRGGSISIYLFIKNEVLVPMTLYITFTRIFKFVHCFTWCTNYILSHISYKVGSLYNFISERQIFEKLYSVPQKSAKNLYAATLYVHY